jgi:hypothetical protein
MMTQLFYVAVGICVTLGFVCICRKLYLYWFRKYMREFRLAFMRELDRRQAEDRKAAEASADEDEEAA